VNRLECAELYFLLDSDGAIIAYQETDQSWAGALAFSSEELAHKFIETSRLEVAEVAAVATDDAEGVGTLIAAMKRRPIRHILLDLDYQTGQCRQVDFEGAGFGAIKERQFVAPHIHA
jgi:hypothetical protein